MNFRAIALLILTALAPSGLPAGIIAYHSLAALMDMSDNIVVGQLAEVDVEGSDFGSIVVLPTETLMGPIVNGPLRVGYERIKVADTASFENKRVIVFLKRSEGGALRLVPLVYGSGVFLFQALLLAESAEPPPLLPRRSSDSPLQKVIKELATIQADSNDSLALTMLMSLARQSQSRPDLTAAFRAIRDSTSTKGRTHGTTGLVALGSLDGLQALDEDISRGQVDSVGQVELLERVYASEDRTGIEILARWLHPSYPSYVRAAAAGALARVHTPPAITLLGEALDDHDFEVRWRVIGGLSMFANNVPIGGAGPAPGQWPFSSDDTFKFSVNDPVVVLKDEQRYLEFWRLWWLKNRESIAELASSPSTRSP